MKTWEMLCAACIAGVWLAFQRTASFEDQDGPDTATVPVTGVASGPTREVYSGQGRNFELSQPLLIAGPPAFSIGGDHVFLPPIMTRGPILYRC